MQTHIDYNDPELAAAAREILLRHDANEAEANITSAVRDILITTKLALSATDAADNLHIEVAATAKGAPAQLLEPREECDRATVTLDRRELCKWLRSSDEGVAVEDAVGRLLG